MTRLKLDILYIIPTQLITPAFFSQTFSYLPETGIQDNVIKNSGLLAILQVTIYRLRIGRDGYIVTCMRKRAQDREG